MRAILNDNSCATPMFRKPPQAFHLLSGQGQMAWWTTPVHLYRINVQPPRIVDILLAWNGKPPDKQTLQCCLRDQGMTKEHFVSIPHSGNFDAPF